MTFAFSHSSRNKLTGVHPDLVRVVYRAMSMQLMDFTVTDGPRTPEQQAELYAKGRTTIGVNPSPTKPLGDPVTWTLNSNHLFKEDGYGHAVDMAPYPIDYDDLDGFTKLARVMREAAREEQVYITWGAVWDRTLNELSDDLDGEIEDYIKRRKALGKRANLDRPHYELVDL